MPTAAKTRHPFAFVRSLGFVIAFVCSAALLSKSTSVLAAEQNDDSSGELSIELAAAYPVVDFVPVDVSDYATLQPIDATTTYTSLNFVNSGVSGLVMSSQLYTGSTSVYGGSRVTDTLGTGTVLTAGVSPTVGGLILSGNMTAISNGAMTLNLAPATPTPTPTPAPTGTYITGVTISMYLNTPATLSSYTGSWALPADYKGVTNGTLTLVGSNSFTGNANSSDSIDGSIPEPTTGLLLFLASVAFCMHRNIAR